jgi:hypothetical protein
MSNQKTSATNRTLFLFAKKLIANNAKKRSTGIYERVSSDFRECMVDLHTRWYEMESDWQKFLSAVRSRNQAEISDKLIDAAVAMLELATATYQGPLSYEASLSPGNMVSLLEQSTCEECSAQGDVEAILPHPSAPQWKLRCPDCGQTWHTVNPVTEKQ